MPIVQEYESPVGQSPFGRWFYGLDAKAAAKITRTIAKLESGLRPDTKSVGEGVMEARIDFGPGYRIYFGIDGPAVIVLLGGGDKRTQQHDIATAQNCWTDYKRRKKQGMKPYGVNP